MRIQSNKHTITINKFAKLAGTSMLLASLGLTGCATTELLEDQGYSTTETTKQVKYKDQVIAFGKPATRLPKMPANSVVIVGEKYSYVMGQGGTQFVNLMTTLDRRYFTVEKDLEFVSKNNDGKFAGTINLSYANLKDEFSRQDIQFFLQNKGKECTTESDARIKAQRFCFNIEIQGGVYPQVSNFNMIKSNYSSLTKPYTVTLYTTKSSERYHPSDTNAAQKLVLLPFALAFDVVTLPLQILD